MKPGERGAALLTVLLLVSVMAVISAAALERLRLSTRLAANAGAIDQARAYAIAAEAIAMARIDTLLEADPARTPLGWNGRETSLPLPGGIANAVMSDGGNCFNLNSVVQGAPGQPLVARPIGITQFVALMESAGVGQGEARKVAASLADWIDTDQDAQPGGGEDAAYAGGEAPYRTANTLVSDPSELRGVAGVTPEIYEKLRPWICALPTSDLSPINVNTLRAEQAVLLTMLMPGRLPPDRARALLIARPAEGYESGHAFWQSSALQGMAPGVEIEQQTGVRTRWFSLRLKVRVGDTDIEETALIDASLAPARLVWRSWGEGI